MLKQTHSLDLSPATLTSQCFITDREQGTLVWTGTWYQASLYWRWKVPGFWKQVCSLWENSGWRSRSRNNFNSKRKHVFMSRYLILPLLKSQSSRYQTFDLKNSISIWEFPAPPLQPIATVYCSASEQELKNAVRPESKSPYHPYSVILNLYVLSGLEQQHG